MPRIQHKVLNKVRKYIFYQAKGQYSTKYLEDEFNINYNRLQKEFKYKFGTSIKEYHMICKCKKLVAMIKSKDENSNKTIFAYAVELGFSSESGLQNFCKRRFNKTFKQILQNPLEIVKSFCDYKCDKICDRR